MYEFYAIFKKEGGEDLWWNPGRHKWVRSFQATFSIAKGALERHLKDAGGGAVVVFSPEKHNV